MPTFENDKAWGEKYRIGISHHQLAQCLVDSLDPELRVVFSILKPYCQFLRAGILTHLTKRRFSSLLGFNRYGHARRRGTEDDVVLRPETCYDLERTQNRYRPSNIVEKDHYGRGGLMVWEGIMADRHANLHVFDKGTLKGQRYRDETLGPYVKLFH
ncbi:hypothetical protein TNCV_3387212 [Trichonephila clavipes]|nr:hypothetical protein TNCV_3387212 [Trichonephila clavipes]